jgi:hypothetical protein
MGDLARARSTSRGPSSGVAAGNASHPSVGTPGSPVPPPSTEYRSIKGGTVFQAAIPSNWKTLSSKNAIRAVPENGYGEVNGQTVFTHGIEFGVAPRGSRDLQQATKAFLNAFAQDNPDLRVDGPQKVVQLSQRSAIGTQRSTLHRLAVRTHHSLHDIRRRRQPVLLLHGCARQRWQRFRGVPPRAPRYASPTAAERRGTVPLARERAPANRPLRRLVPISEVSEAVRVRRLSTRRTSAKPPRSVPCLFGSNVAGRCSGTTAGT